MPPVYAEQVGTLVGGKRPCRVVAIDATQCDHDRKAARRSLCTAARRSPGSSATGARHAGRQCNGSLSPVRANKNETDGINSASSVGDSDDVSAWSDLDGATKAAEPGELDSAKSVGDLSDLSDLSELSNLSNLSDPGDLGDSGDRGVANSSDDSDALDSLDDADGLGSPGAPDARRGGRCATEARPLLSSVDRPRLDHRGKTPPEWSKQERALNSFMRDYPMLSMELTSAENMQRIVDMVERVPVQVRDVPVVGKRFEDCFLRPPKPGSAERACISGDACICAWLAQIRYGEDDARVFVCREFLLPAQMDAYRSSGELPGRAAKCLMCLRYATTSLYVRSRTDVAFRMSVCTRVHMQTHANCVLPAVSCGAQDTAPPDTAIHANAVDCEDGYLRSAMLTDDDGEGQSGCALSQPGAQLKWRPFVRFDSTHYVYCLDSDGAPFVKQVGIGVDLNCRPSSGLVSPATA